MNQTTQNFQSQHHLKNQPKPQQLLLHNLEKSLSSFNSHQLDDLDKASLMDRVDTKFLVPLSLVSQIFYEINHIYTVLEINNKRIFEYKNIYYDTEDLVFYRHHHNGKLNRYKVRLRQYVDSDISFLEVKHKDNKKRTLKTRIQTLNKAKKTIKHSQQFLYQAGIAKPQSLKVVQKSGYHRIAFADEKNAERLTVDFNLYFRKPKNSKLQQMSDHAIFELKQAKLNRQSIFFKIMQKYSIRSCSFSKYCIGMAITHKQKRIKSNNFKSIIRQISLKTKKYKKIKPQNISNDTQSVA